ncbi:MAG: hypothetical protein ACLP1Y_02930 [Candidatus Acidiferrales bacterium]
MKLITLVAAIFLFLGISAKAKAQTSSGLEIQSKCKALVNGDTLRNVDVGFCAGFIDGAIATQQLWDASDKSQNAGHPSLSYCFPQGVTNG